MTSNSKTDIAHTATPDARRNTQTYPFGVGGGADAHKHAGNAEVGKRHVETGHVLKVARVVAEHRHVAALKLLEGGRDRVLASPMRWRWNLQPEKWTASGKGVTSSKTRAGGPVITSLSHHQPPGKPTRVHPHRQQPATNHNNHNNNPERQPPTTTPMTTRIKPHRPPYLGHDKVPVGVLEPDLGAGRRQVRKPPLTPHAGRRGIRTASPAPGNRRPHEVALPPRT